VRAEGLEGVHERGRVGLRVVVGEAGVVEHVDALGAVARRLARRLPELVAEDEGAARAAQLARELAPLSQQLQGDPARSPLHELDHGPAVVRAPRPLAEALRLLPGGSRRAARRGHQLGDPLGRRPR
jgi:hypothetical protein